MFWGALMHFLNLCAGYVSGRLLLFTLKPTWARLGATMTLSALRSSEILAQPEHWVWDIVESQFLTLCRCSIRTLKLR